MSRESTVHIAVVVHIRQWSTAERTMSIKRNIYPVLRTCSIASRDILKAKFNVQSGEGIIKKGKRGQVKGRSSGVRKLEYGDGERKYVVLE